MINIKDLICFGMPKPVSREQNRKSERETVRRIVANISRGNTSLQQGRFITESDLDRIRKENQKHCFCEK